MEKKVKKILGLLIIGLIFIIPSKSYATVECRPSKDGTGTDAIINTSISNSYRLCQEMNKIGGTLIGTSVVPHLATNTDWGAVSYLSNSIYGTNNLGGNIGIEVTIDNVKYYSTNGNATGVMNWGTNPNKTLYTQTAGIITKATTSNDNIKELIDNRATRFVDDIGETKGMAISETKGWYDAWDFIGTNPGSACSARCGLFGVNVGDYGYSHTRGLGFESASGGAFSNTTFRPVVWNE